MNFHYLKRTRVVISLLFFALTIFIFLNVDEKLTLQFSNLVTFIQFSPSLIKFIFTASIASIGFIIILILTVTFGRIYCSSICPLGTLQDIISNISRKIFKQKHNISLKPYSSTRYAILILTVTSLLFGKIIFVNLLDPFSIFGKIAANILRPIYFGINNFISGFLYSINIFFLNPISIKKFEWESIFIATIFLLIIAITSFHRGRLFCNLICPVGTLLGLFSKFSFFQITIDKSKCKSCNLCERECKAGCIDKLKKQIDFSRCVICFNCFNACHSEGIIYKNFLKGSPSNLNAEIDESKRKFIRNLFVYFAILTGISAGKVQIIPKKESTISVVKKFPVSPPGSKSIKHFTSTCTACHLCISTCPTQVLQPSFLEFGFLGMLQPRMDYLSSYCNYDCFICTTVCPTGALEKLAEERKKIIQIGKAIFVKENCIVYTKETACGACSEHCPTKAVDMLEMHKNIKAPKLNNEICIGCGACEYACPTKPHKAIYVEGNPIHLKAQKPMIKKLEERIDVEGDFPF